MQATTSAAWLNELLGEKQPPCVSIYMPFIRSKPGSEQNRIIFGNLADRAYDQLWSRYGRGVADEFAGRLRGIGDGEALRDGARDGLAIFVWKDDVRIVELQTAVDPTVEVGDSFYVKPLVRVMQQGGRFAVLCLSFHNVRLFEGNQYDLREIRAKNLPRSVTETLKGLKGDYPSDAYGQHKMQSHQPATDKDIMNPEQFFLAVDDAVWANYSRESRLPLVVCAETKNLAIFLSMTRNDYVVKQGIAKDPDHLSLDRIREEAWALIEPRYRQERERLIDQFRVAKAHQKGSDELMQVAQAAAVGRVGTLLIDEQAKIPGVLHRASGMVDCGASPDPAGKTDDVLDDLAELVLQKDGEVYVIPHEQMPTDAGVAAVYRY